MLAATAPNKHLLMALCAVFTLARLKLKHKTEHLLIRKLGNQAIPCPVSCFFGLSTRIQKEYL